MPENFLHITCDFLFLFPLEYVPGGLRVRGRRQQVCLTGNG